MELLTVKPVRVIDLKVAYSSLLVVAGQPHPVDTAAAMLDKGNAALLRKDSADDWRALVQFRFVASTEFTPAAAGAPVVAGKWYDPMVTAAQENANRNLARGDVDVVLLSGIGTGALGVTFSIGEAFYEPFSFVDLTRARDVTITHEIGHQLGLLHFGRDPEDIMFRGGFPVDETRSEVTQEDVVAFERWR